MATDKVKTKENAKRALPMLPEGYSYEDKPAEHRLDLRAPNGEIVASGYGDELYDRLRNALAEIKSE